MPTGVAIRGVRARLFDAAERVLRDDGPSALTSRAVTDAAGCAKGVLHRHFADFDGFLAEFVRDRAERINPTAAALRASAGTATVLDNLTGALIDVFSSPVTTSIVSMIIFRDELRNRLRSTGTSRHWPTGVPVLTEAAAMIAGYLTVERDAGRIAADADIDALAATLLGAAHLFFADHTSARPDAAAVRAIVATVIAGVTREPRD
ncbi:MAG: TetR/AcrR family transcriptional regulator [Sciscionella sp.]|nr:TetR/AcrR family transcriptional regulator [Sciscionella sp.]